MLHNLASHDFNLPDFRDSFPYNLEKIFEFLFLIFCLYLQDEIINQMQGLNPQVYNYLIYQYIMNADTHWRVCLVLKFSISTKYSI